MRTHASALARAILFTALAATCTLPSGCINVQATEYRTLNSATSVADGKALTATVDGYFAAWTKTQGQTWTPENLAKHMVTTEEFNSFDGMSQSKTVIDGWAQYAAIWSVAMNQFAAATLSPAELKRAEVSGDMGLWAGLVSINGTMPDGSSMSMPGHLTLILRREGKSWKIIHEHMSLGVKK